MERSRHVYVIKTCFGRPCDALDACESPAHNAQRMLAMEVSVPELLAAAPQQRWAFGFLPAEQKVKLDAGRVDFVFKVGDLVLLRTKKPLDAADIRKLLPLWDGPFTVTACQIPNAYTHALPRKMHFSPPANVD
jgi:hypothetical protein